MDYINFVADYADRTLLNLDHVTKQADGGDQDLYPVTQLWNSLLGLVVLPREHDLALIPPTPLDELWSKGWPHLDITTGADRTRTLPDLVIALRNAVAHFNVKFHADNGEIDAVTLWNDTIKENRRVEGSHRWECTIRIVELESLARSIARLYVNKLATAA